MKTDYIIELFLWCIMFLTTIFAFAVLIFDEINKTNNLINQDFECFNECKKFDYEYYRIDQFRLHNQHKYVCWCLKNNEPISIGTFD